VKEAEVNGGKVHKEREGGALDLPGGGSVPGPFQGERLLLIRGEDGRDPDSKENNARPPAGKKK